MDLLIIGSGVVGSATGKGFAKLGHNVAFVDTKQSVVDVLLTDGYKACLPQDYPSQDFYPEAVIVTVPTPSMPDGEVELSYLSEAAKFCATHVLSGNAGVHTTIIVRSTVPPGTTRNLVLPKLESLSGKSHGESFSVCFHPEFLRAVSAEEDFLNPWIIVAGTQDEYGRDAVNRLYDDLDTPVTFTDIETAEMIKYVSNCFNAAKISYANEIWNLASRLGLDGNEILGIARQSAEGYWNPRYGTLGGRPYGGTCLPKDTSGLLNFSKRIGIDMPLLNAVIEVNERMSDLAKEGQVLEASIEGPNWIPATDHPKARLKAG